MLYRIKQRVFEKFQGEHRDILNPPAELATSSSEQASILQSRPGIQLCQPDIPSR